MLTQKKRRGPEPTGKGTLVGVRLQPDLLEWLDAERLRAEPVKTRPEMVRHFLESMRDWAAERMRDE